jgi:hypothetical protein
MRATWFIASLLSLTAHAEGELLLGQRALEEWQLPTAATIAETRAMMLPCKRCSER